MTNLLHSEWLKLSRRPMTWILLGVFLLLMFIYFTSLFLVVALQEGTFTGGTTIIQFFDEERLSQLHKELSFPGIFAGVLGQVNSAGGICAIILAAGTLGSEYSWGTLRLQLSRQPHRGRYFVAKTLMLFIVLLLGIIIALLFGSLLALVYGAIMGNTGSVSLRDLLILPLGILRALYVILPYVMVTLAICVVGRSVFAGVAGGLIFLFLDASSGTLSFLAELGNPLITFLVNLPLQQNINTMLMLNRSAYGLDPSIITGLRLSAQPSPLFATVVIAAYSVLFFWFAYRRLTRRDIGGAT